VAVHLDEALLDDLLNSPGGPVGVLISDLSHAAEHRAKLLAPVMKRRNLWHFGGYFNPERQYGPFGATKQSVRWSGFLFNGRGQMYSGVNVNYGPTLFLERPARQVRPVFMFMSEALNSVAL
jgi:hypothetical protein